MNYQTHLLFITMLFPFSVCSDSQKKATVAMYADKGKDIFSRHIYSHFSEHQGCSIHEGARAGEDFNIPNANGVRKNIIRTLKPCKIPNLRRSAECYWMDVLLTEHSKIKNQYDPEKITQTHT